MSPELHDPVDYRWETIPITGVDLVFPDPPGPASSPQEITMVVGEGGDLARDVALPYRILPETYQANTAYLYLYKDGNPIILEPVETSGSGFATLARGLWLEPGGKYTAEVVLNQFSGAEISSEVVPVRVVELELVADLNRDGNYVEGDPLEHTSPGLLLPLNNDDDDGDGVVDFDDGFDQDGLPGTPDDAMQRTNPDGTVKTVTDDDLLAVQLTALPTDLATGTVVLELIQGRDQVRVWSSPDKGKDKVLLDAGGINGATTRKEWVLGRDIASLAELPPTLYLEGVKAAASAADTAILITKYISPEGTETEADRLLITVYSGGLVPDYDRNGVIDELDRAKVNPDQPWRFWVNDDNDTAADAMGIGSSENDQPGLNKDNADNQVNGIRDLVDFFPVKLDLGQVITILPPEQGYSYWLRQATGAVAVVEGVRVDPTLLASNSGSYLTDLAVAGKFAMAATTLVTADGVKLSDTFIQAIKNNDQAGIILVEGRKETTNPLVVEVRDSGGQLVVQITLPLEIVGVEQMYGHRNLRSVAGGPGGDGDRFTTIDPQTHKILVGKNQEIGKQPFCMQGVDKTLVWMHGYRVSPTAARGTFSEVFKRFFHTGLTGRFYGVSWYGDPPAAAIGPPHYHQAVVNAFATAQAYTDFISAIPGATSIAAHSLGNLVVGSAIHDKGMAGFTKYFAVDAAVALEAYGQVDIDEGMVKVDNWLDYWQYQGTDTAGKPVSGDKLLASEWYKRFPSDDNRSKLTWRNRLSGVVSTLNGPKVYNFYSKTEEVLRAYPDDDLVKIFELLKNYKDFIAYLATSSWVKQEKFKGRRSFFNIADGIGGVSSPFAGWSFNPDWDVDTDQLGVRIRRTPEQAAAIAETELMTKPFFNLPTFKLFGADLAELVSGIGSDFVDVEVKYTGLDSYYTSNNAAHDKVKIKDWLLAEAFPATTLPMGANENGALTIDGQNINMSGVKDDNGGCCKTREDLWPRDDTFIPGIGDWKHSDYKDVPYQLVSEFYNKINTLTK